jgi:hypothetical protein
MFATISTVLDSIVTPGFSAGVWYGWVFLLSPINGIVLGPVDGFVATLISVIVGHTFVFRESFYEYIFTLGAPIASLISGLVYKKKNVILYFVLLLGAYFLSPVSRELPIWGMWDVYLAFFFLLSWTLIEIGLKIDLLGEQTKRLALAAYIGLEADILFRIFILVPCKGYIIFYGLTPQVLAALWAVVAPIITPSKVIISVFFTTFLVPKINKTLSSINFKLN